MERIFFHFGECVLISFFHFLIENQQNNNQKNLKTNQAALINNIKQHALLRSKAANNFTNQSQNASLKNKSLVGSYIGQPTKSNQRSATNPTNDFNSI